MDNNNGRVQLEHLVSMFDPARNHHIVNEALSRVVDTSIGQAERSL